MNELRKLVAAGDLLEAADLMKVQLGLLEQQFIDTDLRLRRIEQEDARRRNFWEAEAMAPASATIHKAPRGLQ
jgi:hypothetical protein